MFLEAGIDTENHNIRNHSGKVTLCTRLYQQNFLEQQIMARSGHRSVAVRDYKGPSEEMQQSVSEALQPPRPGHNAVATPPPPPELKLENTEDKPPVLHDDGCIEIVLPSTIHTVVLVKDGRKSLVAV